MNSPAWEGMDAEIPAGIAHGAQPGEEGNLGIDGLKKYFPLSPTRERE